MSYEFRPFSEIPEGDWDNLVAHSHDAWLYHTTRAIRWHSTNQAVVNCSFGVYDSQGALCAATPLYLIRTDDPQYRLVNFGVRAINYALHRTIAKRPLARRQTALLSCDPEAFSGPFFRNEFNKKSRAHLLKAMIRQIDELAERFRAKTFELRMCEPSISLHPVNRPPVNPTWLAGVSQPYTYPPRLTAYVDLSGGAQSIWKQLDEDCRAAVNKGTRSGLEFVSNDRKNILRFHAIHTTGWDRTMGHHQPIERFERMFNFLDQDENIHVFFAKKADEDLATVLLHTHKKTALYFGGASYADGQRFSPNNYLLHGVMLWAMERGCDTFVVGLFDAHCVDRKSYSVGQYKAQFSKTYCTTFETKKFYDG